MLANGYSRAQMERAKTLQDTTPQKIAVLIHGYCAKLRTEEGKLREVTLFVAVGIDFFGTKDERGCGEV